MPRSFFSQWRRAATPVALALVSLIAAVGLWIAVTDAENPRSIANFGGGVEVLPVNLGEGLAVAGIREPNVSLRVSADEDTLSKLTTADFRAEVNMSGVRETSDQRVVVHVVGNKEVEIVEIRPELVTVVVEQAVTRQVPVRANFIGQPSQGFSVTPIEPSPSTARITGASSLVQLVSSVTADINITGLRATIQQQYPLVARDNRGVDIRGVFIEPGNADMRVTVVQQEVTLAMTIVPAVQGTIADGYNLVSIASDPPAIQLSGPLEVLQGITSIPTEAIDISGLRANVSRTVRLRVPAPLQAPRDSVTVRLHVVPAQGEAAIAAAPQVTNVGEGLRASLQTASVTVRIGGELPALRALAPGSVRVMVSAAGLDEGVHVLKPTITVPEGMTVISGDPAQVVVVIRR